MALALTQAIDITLQTRAGSYIVHHVDHRKKLADIDELTEKYSREFRVRAMPYGPSPIYNCHGLTFAGRRGWLDEGEVIKILKEDDYKEVHAKDAQVGNIVVYFGQSNDPQHSGIIVEVRTLNNFLVLSKWGPGREFVHAVGDCPYPKMAIKYYRIEL